MSWLRLWDRVNQREKLCESIIDATMFTINPTVNCRLYAADGKDVDDDIMNCVYFPLHLITKQNDKLAQYYHYHLQSNLCRRTGGGVGMAGLHVNRNVGIEQMFDLIIEYLETSLSIGMQL